MKRAVVCGAGGLIGSYMVSRLKAEGYHVVGLSRSQPKYQKSAADEFWTMDLRNIFPNEPMFAGADEVYQFACEVGGLGYIANHVNDAEMLHNSTMIDLSVLEACRQHSVPKVFFASSACVYSGNKRFFAEADAYPSQCSNEFAWQKVFAERLYQSYARCYGIDVRIGRLFNTYGVGMAWTGGREKSVAALCRKIAEVKDGGIIEVWGHGEQTRSYSHVDDTVEGIWRLMQYSRPNANEPLNIGTSHDVTIRDLVKAISRQAGKHVFCKFVDGPVGVSHICSDNTLVKAKLGWEPSIDIEKGLAQVYPWIKQMVLDKGTTA